MNYAKQIEEIEKLEKASAHLSQPYINLLTLARKMQEEINRVEKHNFILKTMGQIYVKEEWIPCTERLPEEEQDCIITVVTPDGKRLSDAITFYKDLVRDVKWHYGETERIFANTIVIAWMPLPEPFKGDI